MSAPYQLFDALPPHVEQALRDSIALKGVMLPVLKDQHGNILDGHHRVRIADELGIKYRVDTVVVDDSDDAESYARVLNIARRHLTAEEIREHIISLAVRVNAEGAGELSQNEIARLAGVDRSTVNRILNDVQVVQLHNLPAERAGLDGKTYKATRPSIVASMDLSGSQRAQDALSQVDTLPSKVMDVKRVERLAREQHAERRRAEAVELATLQPGNIDIRHGDFLEVLADVPDGSIDAIITDPPYPNEYWDPSSPTNVYTGLGVLARRVLKPNGVLAVMIGTGIEMMDAVDAQIGANMRRRHRLIFLTPGQMWRDYKEHLTRGYKPILLFAHPDADDLRWLYRDIFTGDGKDQRFHHWGQSEAGFAQIVEALTLPGELVMDPFLGGGTTAVVCRDLKRSFIGADNDGAAVMTARERIDDSV